MATLTRAQMTALINLEQPVLGDAAPSKDHIYNVLAEVPSVDLTVPSWNPSPITENDKNAISINGIPVYSLPTTTGDALQFDAAEGRLVFAPIVGGGGGGSSITVKAFDSTPTYAGVATLEIDEGDGFILSSPGLNRASLRLDNIPVDRLASLSFNLVAVTNGSGKLTTSTLPSSKLNFLANVSSDIQVQIDAKPSVAIAALTQDVTASSNGIATLASVGTPGTYTKVTTDAKGRVIAGTTLVSGDLPSHSHALANLTDFTITSPSNGQVLSYNSGTSRWVNTTPSSGGSSAFSFEVNFDGSGVPTTVTSLPGGWSSSVAGTSVTITHTAGAMPSSIVYYGYDGSNWHYRLPTAANEVSIIAATQNTQFNMTLNNAVAGATAGQKALIKVVF